MSHWSWCSSLQIQIYCW